MKLGAPAVLFRFVFSLLPLASRDLLVLYTDGLIEAKSEAGGMFGIERLKRLIEEHSSLGARKLFAKLEAGIQEFIGQAPPFDDLTLIVTRVKQLILF